SGFVARHFIELLSTMDEKFMVAGIYNRDKPEFCEQQYPNVTLSLHQLNMEDRIALEDLLSQFRPGYIVHLASKSSVAYSWENPAETILGNTGIFLNLLEAVKHLKLDCRILSIGSAEEYGNVKSAELPLRETYCASPVS